MKKYYNIILLSYCNIFNLTYLLYKIGAKRKVNKNID